MNGALITLLLLFIMVACSPNKEKKIAIQQSKVPIGFWVMDKQGIKHCIQLDNNVHCSLFPVEEYRHMLRSEVK